MSSFERLYPAKETGQKQIDFKTPVAKPIQKPVVKILNQSKPEIKIQKQTYSFNMFWGLIKINKY